jgi:CRISPR type III-A-associated RAMP protein Csm4
MPRHEVGGENKSNSTDRKKSIAFSSLKNIMDVMAEFKRGGITKERSIEILENINGKDISGLSYYRANSEYAVSLQEQVPRVYVRELSTAGNIGRRNLRGKELLTFDPIYFIAKYSLSEFSVAMDYIEDAGFSGMISRGKGHFIYGRVNSDLKTDFSGEGYYLIISKYCPSEDDFNSIDLERSYYAVSTFAGISADNTGLPKIRYFEPGSILFLKGEIKGKAISTHSGKRILNFSALKVKVG